MIRTGRARGVTGGRWTLGLALCLSLGLVLVSGTAMAEPIVSHPIASHPIASHHRALEAELSFYAQVFGFEPADALEPVTLA